MIAERVEKRENEIKDAYWAHFAESYPASLFFAMQHQDVRKPGYPDSCLHGFGRSSYWEFKHATPNFKSPGLQELNCRRIARHGFSCLYVIFVEHNNIFQTRICHPRDVFEQRGKLANISFLDSWQGHDFIRLAKFMHDLHVGKSA
jgi:hypothetical protein